MAAARVHVLAIDLGTTRAKAALFDRNGRRVALVDQALSLKTISSDGAEQDAEAMAVATRRLLARLDRRVPGAKIVCAGVSCQRSTLVLWDRETTRPRGAAVSWKDRRAAPIVERLAAERDRFRSATGLRLTPHYAGLHLARRLESDGRLRESARSGSLVAGPVGTFVLARIGCGTPAACDPTLAQRTLLYDPWRGEWDAELCRLLGVPAACLPDTRPTVSEWGTVSVGRRRVPVVALAGDQQAAAAAFDLEAGHPAALLQYGTGAFALWPAQSLGKQGPDGLLLSARADLPGSFYVEGTVNAAGSALDAVGRWIGRRTLSRALSRALPARDLVASAVLVPAFAGLGAPHWRPGARAVLYGADRADGPGALAVAAALGIAQRLEDVLEAGQEFLGPDAELIASGPLVGVPALMRAQADVSGRVVRASSEEEATLRGIARIAARAAGLPDFPPASTRRPIAPRATPEQRARLRDDWRAALSASWGTRP